MTASDAFASVLDAYAALEQLAAGIDEEWQYVADLAETHRGAMEALARGLGDAELPEAVAVALGEAVEEIALITDPHRAIDWLSTFPHVVALALGAPLWAEGAR